MPPISCPSLAVKRPPGRRSAINGVRLETAYTSSISKRIPASCAIAGICSAALVDPPVAAIDPELELAAPNIGASARRTALTVTLQFAMLGVTASAIFVFLESLDEFTGTYFVGVPDVTALPLAMFTASLAGNYQIAAITALVLLVPSVGFMLVIEPFLKAEMLAKIG